MALADPTALRLTGLLREILDVIEQVRVRPLAPGQAASCLDRLAGEAESWLEEHRHALDIQHRARASSLLADVHGLVQTLTDAENHVLILAEQFRTVLPAQTAKEAVTGEGGWSQPTTHPS